MKHVEADASFRALRVSPEIESELEAGVARVCSWYYGGVNFGRDVAEGEVTVTPELLTQLLESKAITPVPFHYCWKGGPIPIEGDGDRNNIRVFADVTGIYTLEQFNKVVTGLRRALAFEVCGV